MNDGNEECAIGNDSLFSWGIKIRTSDGHSVVDLDSGMAINMPKNVKIGDRVWVSEDVSFLKGAEIPSDCVVGSRAVVTKAFNQSHCVIAGFPAKIVKENIKWDRRMPTEFNDIRHSAALLGINFLIDASHTINDNTVPLLYIEDYLLFTTYC